MSNKEEIKFYLEFKQLVMLMKFLGALIGMPYMFFMVHFRVHYFLCDIWN